MGEERLAQFLLAILNTRKTPLHWERLNKEQTVESPFGPEGSHGNPLRESIPNRRRRPNDSDISYIQVLYDFQLSTELFTMMYAFFIY